jgi:hypothetical protein
MKAVAAGMPILRHRCRLGGTTARAQCTRSLLSIASPLPQNSVTNKYQNDPPLTPTGLLLEGDYTNYPDPSGVGPEGLSVAPEGAMAWHS